MAYEPPHLPTIVLQLTPLLLSVQHESLVMQFNMLWDQRILFAVFIFVLLLIHSKW